MGPLEAVSGMMLFGLSTAFLLAIMQRIWPFPPDDEGGSPVIGEWDTSRLGRHQCRIPLPEGTSNMVCR
jgi:hypothetical protein